MRQVFFLLNFLFCFCTYVLQAQEIPYPEKNVTVNFSNTPLSDVFKSLSNQTGVVFSYSSFDDQKKISLSAHNKTLRIVLNQVALVSNSSYKLKGKYVIIKTAPITPVLGNSSVVLSGYIYNAQDSSKIDRASVYIETSKRSSLTNEYGYFFLSGIDASSPVKLSIAKQNYYDTAISVVSKKDTLLAIYLHPKLIEKKEIAADTMRIDTARKDSLVKVAIVDSISAQPDLLEQLRMGFKKFNSNFKNISDTLFSNFALSLAPYISTNRLLSGNTVNNGALNLTVGYSKGVRLFEIGGVMNIDDGNVKYFQVAGAGNIVSENVSGVQIAGVLNLNRKRTDGFQVAGVYNDTYKMNGMQVAGVFNNTYTMNGMQIAGVVNRNEGHAKGMQIAGVINLSDTVSGFQIAGLVNHSDYAKGVQISTINIARKLKGVQLGFINVSDTCKGIPIGFISYVKTGYHKLELSYDELGFGTLYFGSGANEFHNIFLGGYNFSQPHIFTYGYGLGSSLKLSRKWNLKFDVTGQQIQSSEIFEISLNLLSKAYVGLEFAPFKGIRIGVGPSFNVFTADISSAHYAPTQSIFPSDLLYNQTHGTTNVKTWIGAKVALKFF